MTEPENTDKTVSAYSPFPIQGHRGDEVDLLEYWRVIWRGRLFILLFVTLSVLASLAISYFVLEETYQSTATLIPIKDESSSLGKLNGLIGNLPLPISIPGQGKNNIMTFLDSRTLKERLITKYDMLPVLYPDLWDSGKKQWLVSAPEKKPTLVTALQEEKIEDFYSSRQDPKNELITIDWEGRDPGYCARMVNHVIAELTFFLENEYDSNAKREREFVEKQLEKTTAELEYWERQIPDEKLTLSKISRERITAQTVYTELRKQLELAKISEARKLESFKVLDKPFIPEKPFQPKKLLIVALTAFCSTFIALFLVFFHNFLRTARQREASTPDFS
ncbi:MAG: hypothetical protein KKG47_02970 [Proteobacteria bacterium]|nr:hypothetical protein [Pseudomonadota bacterium]MBU1738855.1 hypothetical protein [Pseudomonadota bacterium]